MAAISATLLIVLIAAVAAIVLGPLGLMRKERPTHAAEISELEAEREAKYREIRDAELDHEMGKLLDSDYEEIDASLRREAVAILDQIEALEASERDEAQARELAQAREAVDAG